MSLPHVARGLAAAFLAGDWTREGMTARGRQALGEEPLPWLARLAGRTRRAFAAPPHHDVDALADFLHEDAGLGRAWGRRLALERPLTVREVFLTVAAMRPERLFDVPDLPTEQDLAAWLGLAVSDLDWLADTKGWLRRAPPGPRHHYRHRWLGKADGTRRLLEAPKEVLKGVQRRLLDRLLVHVTPHDAAHGFVRGRSVLSFARPHAGQELVLRMDLRDFFPSVSGGRVLALFRALGYPPDVARALMGLVTTRTPEEVLGGSGLDPGGQDRLRRRHLPQGAPTSPAVANLCALRLDARLSGAAAAVAARYTRYADDLAFSGGPAFRGEARGLQRLVAHIAADEGFAVRGDKSRWMTRGSRQRLVGLVVNERPRPARAEYERLKAILCNCVRLGPSGQNRAGHPEFEAHLRGRVAWFEQTDPPRGARLRASFERIAWGPTAEEGASAG